MAEGFLGRWSQRKRAVSAGQPAPEPETKVVPPPVPAIAATRPLVDPVQPVAGAAAPQPAPVPLTVEDAQALTPESDFKPFVASHVSPEVKNAAMKKLFADPHFNVMDRLDIYIDDYSRPDPLPDSMLRQMASAKFLKLFEEDEQDETENQVRDDANTPTDQSVAQSGQPPRTGTDHLTENTPQARGTDHDNTDLRLQPNHAAGPQEPGGRAQ